MRFSTSVWSMPRKAGVTKVGDNVFVGMKSIILMGSQIGNNVIIGAGAVVSGNIPDNVVVAGNPAKVVCTLDDYYERQIKRLDSYLWLINYTIVVMVKSSYI